MKQCDKEDCFAYVNPEHQKNCFFCKRNKANKNIKHALEDKYQTSIEKWGY